MIAVGVFRVVVNGEGAAPVLPDQGAPDLFSGVGIFLLIRAFASGSVALTGTEAIANGVPAFKPPEPKNAATTLGAVAILLAILFLGITFVASSFGVLPTSPGEAPKTVISQVAGVIYGEGTVLFYLFQTFTALILFLAANTSYNAFPRLAAILATDGYMPRQFSFRGDRLAFTSGVLILSVVAVALLLGFNGETHALIPLYSVGVFIAFTVGQSGMIVHWLRERPPGWRYATRDQRVRLRADGARRRRGHDRQGADVAARRDRHPDPRRDHDVHPPPVPGVVRGARRPRRTRSSADRTARSGSSCPCPGINRAVVQAVNVGLSIDPNVQAVLISDDPEEAAEIRARWEQQLPEVPLVIVESPYRALVAPLLSYLDVLDRAWPADKDSPITFVVIPEYVARSWWERILYNQSAKRLRAALLGRPHTVVVNVPYRREEPGESSERPTAPPRSAADAARIPAFRPGVIGSSPMERAGGWLWRLLLVGAAVRIVGLLSPGHGGDLIAFVTWAEDAAEHGLGGYYASRWRLELPADAVPALAARDGARRSRAHVRDPPALDPVRPRARVAAVRDGRRRDGPRSRRPDRGGLLPAQSGRDPVRPDLGPGRRHGRPADGRGDRRGGPGQDRGRGRARRHRRPDQAPVRDRRVRPGGPRALLASVVRRDPAARRSSRSRRW